MTKCTNHTNNQRSEQKSQKSKMSPQRRVSIKFIADRQVSVESDNPVSLEAYTGFKRL